MGIIRPELIRKKRKELELTQNQLAKKAGVSQSIIAKIESNRIEPSYKIIEQLSLALSENTKLAKDIMQKKVIKSTGDKTKDIAKMRKHNISQLLIDSNRVVSERSLLQKKEFEEVPSLPENASIDSVRQLLFVYQCVIIVNRGIIVGIITRADLL